jgi:hypothetical protein
MNVDDAGVPGCVQYTQCVIDCVNPPADSGVEAGSPATCAMDCGMPYSATETAAGNAFLLCVQGMCSMAPDGGTPACQ